MKITIIINSYRYNLAAHTSEFLADGSQASYWQSESGDMTVTVALGFSSSVSLSKIFIHFETPLPAAAILQFLPEGTSTWEDLQYFADNCTKRFNMEDNRQ